MEPHASAQLARTSLSFVPICKVQFPNIAQKLEEQDPHGLFHVTTSAPEHEGSDFSNDTPIADLGGHDTKLETGSSILYAEAWVHV